MILIVDDKPENIFSLKKLLEVNSFGVDTALSGEEALRKVLKNDYSLIILDVQMPGMDGFEVAEAISGLGKAKDIPIIFLSAASTDKHFITKGYSSGGIDYVAKPVDPDILLLKVKTFHRLYEQSRELSELHLEQKLANDLLERRVKNRTSELIAANKELAFQNEEKEKRAAELIVANNELIFQNGEKEKRAKELVVANRLYAFISRINHTIVHAADEQTVFNEACSIAVDIGKFDEAWICMPDTINKKRNIVAHNNSDITELQLLGNTTYGDDGPTAIVLQSGKFYIMNDFELEFGNSIIKKYALKNGFKSAITLPVKRSGETIGTFNIFSVHTNLFNEVEIALLEEAAGDISFALEVFEKERDRKLSEDKVIHSEFRLKQAQAIAHIGSWEEDISTGIKTWSEEVCRIYDIPAEENKQSNESWGLFIHPADRDYVMDIVNGPKTKLRDSAFNYRIIRWDGTIRSIYCQIHFEFDENGMPIAKYGVVHDVTETKEAEQSLAQSEANLRLIMDSIPQLISTRNIEGKFLFVNKSFAELMGMTQKELLEKSLTNVMPVNSESEYYLKQDREVILSGKMKTNPEHYFTDYKENKRIFHTLKIPLVTAGTNEKAVLGITSEITEQKLADKERTKMIADILQRNKNLEQFSYIVSHNLRAPVANILGIVGVMQTIGVEQEEAEKVTGYLGIAAKNLDNVIMDLNKILEVNNEVIEKKETIKFAVLLDEITSGINGIIKDEKVQIICDFSKADEISTVKSYLHSIFLNLISNSIKFRQNHIALIIEISSARLKNKIRLIFKDNGLGMDIIKYKKDLFGLYKRFHNHVEGKGIGLFMVKTQLEKLGGTITIASEVNKGTEFTIEFENN